MPVSEWEKIMSSTRPNQLFRNKSAKIAAIPMIVTALLVFVGGTIWTVVYSFTNSGLLPRLQWVGLDQYERLWATRKWLVSIENLAIYGLCMLVLVFVIGFILAALIDQKIRFEDTIRTVILYPYALSFVVTGLVWQWMLNPEFGVQKVVRGWGWESFTFDPLYSADIAIYGVLIAGIWQGSGLVMVLMLAGLRGIDQDVWKASRVDGIPTWKAYIFVIIPMMRPVFVTTLVIVVTGIVKIYDLIVAQTGGGPGISTEVPAKYVYDMMFQANNLGQGFAASTMMLVTVALIVIPWAILEFGGSKHRDLYYVRTPHRPAGSKAAQVLFASQYFPLWHADNHRIVLCATPLRDVHYIPQRDAGNPPWQCVFPASRGDVSALGQSVVRGLHRLDLQRVEHRILELCSNHYTIRGLVDHHRVREWLRIVQLEIQRR